MCKTCSNKKASRKVLVKLTTKFTPTYPKETFFQSFMKVAVKYPGIVITLGVLIEAKRFLFSCLPELHDFFVTTFKNWDSERVIYRLFNTVRYVSQCNSVCVSLSELVSVRSVSSTSKVIIARKLVFIQPNSSSLRGSASLLEHMSVSK